MATSQTTNYKLNLWQPTDKFIREEFNENTNKLDAAIKAVDTKAAAKADASALTVEINARKTAVNNEASARAAADTAEANARTAAVQDLESRKAAFVLLKEVSVSKQVTQFTVNVSDINWGAWQYVFMDFDLEGYGEAKMLPNGNGDNAYYTIGQNTGRGYLYMVELNGGRGRVRIRFDVCKSPSRNIRISACGPYGLTEYMSYQELKSLKLVADSSNYYISAGGTIRFWGLA